MQVLIKRENSIILRSIYAATVTLLLTACPTRKVQRYQHEGPVAQKHPGVQASTEVSLKELSEIKIERLQPSRPENQRDLYATVVAPLAKFILNRNYVESAEYIGTIKMRQMLEAFNSAILQLLEKSPAVLDREKILERYEQMLLSGCSIDLSDLVGCTNFRFYKSDSQTAKIVQKIATKAKDVRRYYKLLALAFELQNRARDRDLEFMYLRRAREYAEYYRSLPEGDKEKPLMRRHGIIFDTLLKDILADPSNSQFRAFIMDFEPWTYSRQEGSAFHYGRERLFQLAANGYLYEKSGLLSQDLRQAIASSQSKEDSLGPSFTQIVKSLNSGAYGSVLRGLDVGVNDVLNGQIQDEYFFIIDRLYRGHIDVDEAKQIWLGSKKNETRFLNTLALYLRIQIIQKIFETNEFMSEIYANPKYDSNTMIKTVLEKSLDISERWIGMLKRIELLKRLVNSQLRQFGLESGSLRTTNLMFDSIRRNIKYMAVYPNMFLMSYFLTKNKAIFTIYTFWGEIKIDHTLLVNAMFDGKLAPWFRFGNDEVPLSKIELLYAFHFALNNGSFETFSKIKESNGQATVDRVGFLKEIIKEYTGNENQELKKSVESLRSMFSSNSYRQFLNQCQLEKVGRDDFSLQMEFEKIGNYTYFGGGDLQFQSPLAHVPFAFYAQAATGLNQIDGHVRNKLALVRTMVEMLKYDLAQRGLGEAEVKRVTQDLSELVRDTEKYRTQYITETIRRHREIGDCVERARTIEFRRQNQLFKEEIEHLRKVYRDMLPLQSLQGEPLQARLRLLNESYGFTRANIEGENLDVTEFYKFDVITQKTYRYSKYDLFVRMMNRMSRMRPMTKFLVPSDLNLSLDFYREKTGDQIELLDIRGQPISEDQFVMNAMRNLNGMSEHSWVKWASQPGKNDFNESKVRTLAVLFRLSYGVSEFREQIHPREVLQEVKEMVRLATIAPEEVPILKILGRERKQSLDDLRRFMLDGKTGEERPVFENAFKLMTDAEKQLAEAKQFYLAIKHAGYFLFAPNDSVLKIMRDQYRPFVDSVRLRTQQLIGEVAKANETTDPAFLRFAYELNGQRLIYYQGGSAANGRTQFLSPRSIADSRATEKEFDRDTENYFHR